MDDLPDGRLLAAWHRDRDARAFAALCERHAGLVGAVCRRQGSPDIDAAAQAVFLVLARKAGAVPPATLAGWLTITARQIVAHQRRAAAVRRRHEEAAAMEHARHDAAAGPDWAEARPLLDAALASLSPGRREAIVRFYLQGRPQSEVAAELGCSVDAVKTRVHEGLGRLRAFFARRGVAIGAAALASGLAGEAAAADPALAAVCARVAGPGAVPAAASLVRLAARAAGLRFAAIAATVVLAGGAAATALAPSPPPPGGEVEAASGQDASALLAAMGGLHAVIELVPAGEDLSAGISTIGFADDAVVGTDLAAPAGGGPSRWEVILTAGTFSRIRGNDRLRVGPVRPAGGWPALPLHAVAAPAADHDGRILLAYSMPAGTADPAPQVPRIADVAEGVVLTVAEGASAAHHPAAPGRARVLGRRPVAAADLAWHLGLACATFEVDRAAAAGLRGWFEGYSAGRQSGAGSAPVPLATRFTVFCRDDGAEMSFWLASGATIAACRMAKPPEDPVYARDPRFAAGSGHRFGFQTFPSLDDAMDDAGRISIAVDWPGPTVVQTRSQVEPAQAFRAIALRLAHGPDGARVRPGQLRMVPPAPDAADLARVLGHAPGAPADPPAPAGF